MRKIILFSLSFILISFISLSQNNVFKTVNKISEDGSSYVLNNSVSPVSFVPDVINPYGTVTDLTTFADYVTNGNNLRKVIVLGDTVVVTGDYLDSNFTALSERVIRYNVSYDAGLTWETNALVVSTTDNQAYGVVTGILTSSGRSVAITGRQYAGGSRGFGGTDLLIGLGIFTYSLNPEPNREYVGSLKSSSLLGGTNLSTNDTVYYFNFDYTSNTFVNGSKVLLSAPPENNFENTRQTSAVSTDGQNVFAMWWNGTADQESLAGKESTNGGTSFGSSFIIQPYHYIADGDTLYAWFGMDAIYKPNTNIKCAAFCSNAVSDYGARKQYKLLFWSPGINSGNPVIVADYRDTALHLMNDSLTFYNYASTVQVGMTYVSHPSIAFTDDGSRLICVFTGAQVDTAYGYNFNDIFESYSDDNGATWSEPRNLTNTPDIDEIYPAIAKEGNTPGNLGVVFQVSECPGSNSFNQTTTPRCPVYWVYRRYDPVTGNLIPIGVKTVSNEVPNSFALHQNYPNPFNPSTKIKFDMPKNSFVTLKVYDMLGRLVSTLINNERITAGEKEVTFAGHNLASGVYFYRIEAGEFTATRKMTLVK
jgi:hypothetical protein